MPVAKTEEEKRRAREYAVARRKASDKARAAHVACAIASAKKRRASDPSFVEAQRAYQVEYHKRKSQDPAYVERRRANTKCLRERSEYLAQERERAIVADRARNAKPEVSQRKRAYMRTRHQEPAVKERHRLTAQRRRARLNDACSPGVTLAQWRVICERFATATGEIACAYCRKPCAATIDHVVPIARGGKDAPDNVVPCCRFCNTSKGARLLSEWHRTPKDFAERTACLAQNNSTPERAMTG